MQGSQKESGELDILWIIGAVLFTLGLIFILFRTEILTVILWIKYGELKIISFFVLNDDYQGLANWVNEQNPNRVSFSELDLISREIGMTLQVPCILLCLFLATVIYFKHPESGFRDTETMDTLSEKMRGLFPALNIVAGLNLAKVNIDEGPWAMGLTPIEFAKKHKLMAQNIKTGKIVLDHYKTKLVFTQQLAEPFPGVAQLKPHEKALFAIFAAYINYKRDEAERTMEEIVRQITPEKLKKNKLDYHTDALLKKYEDTPKVQKIITQHAYTNTIFMEMLTEARKSGIVLNSLYLWLKPIDRRLWYVLNNVGRKAVFIEAAAVQAHWLAERRLGFTIKQPMVDEAIFALDEAIQNRIIKEV